MAAEATTPEPEGAAAAAPAPPPRKASVLSVIIELGFLTCLAVGAGGLFGMMVIGGSAQGSKPEPVAAQPHKAKAADTTNVKPLPAIVTNLATPQKTWVRLEASIVYSDATPDINALAATIAEDVIAFLRTVPLAQLEGPSGFLHLREDLNERARIRSAGKVRELVIQSLVLE